MDSIFAKRQPAAALRYFEEISAVPRGSGNEKGIAEYLERFAKDHGLEVYVDEVYNVIIKKPGSKGCESLPPVMLQGHSDIVCEKNQDTAHNFEKDPLKLRLNGDILTAEGTTLGGDDGYAVAYMLAILADGSLVHPPLECVFTAMEEIGLVGALKLDMSRISARRMIGLDAGMDGHFMCSSAGGTSVYFTVPGDVSPCDGVGLKISIRGLLGGHSGGMIDKERGNANGLMGRILYCVRNEVKFRIVTISGGMKGNAIPRESDCIIALGGADAARAKEIIESVGATIASELRFSDPGFAVRADETTATLALCDGDTERVLNLHHLIPYGVQSMSMAVKGLVSASLNFASVKHEDGVIKYVVSIRGECDSRSRCIADRVVNLAKLCGAEASVAGFYPAYPYSESSAMRELTLAAYKELTGLDGTPEYVHGGTECGVFSLGLPGLDIISMGPDSGELHTPSEWMDIASFGRVYTLLLTVLEKLTK